MSRGGKRPGAGRKKGFAALEAEQARKLLAERVHENIIPIADKLIEKALNGDVSAVKELLDRSWGKPMQSVEMSVKDGKDLFENSEDIKKITTKLNALHRGTSITGDGGSSSIMGDQAQD